MRAAAVAGVADGGGRRQSSHGGVAGEARRPTIATGARLRGRRAFALPAGPGGVGSGRPQDPGPPRTGIRVLCVLMVPVPFRRSPESTQRPNGSGCAGEQHTPFSEEPRPHHGPRSGRRAPGFFLEAPDSTTAKSIPPSRSACTCSPPDVVGGRSTGRASRAGASRRRPRRPALRAQVVDRAFARHPPREPERRWFTRAVIGPLTAVSSKAAHGPPAGHRWGRSLGTRSWRRQLGVSLQRFQLQAAANRAIRGLGSGVSDRLGGARPGED